jgi:peptidoglycan/LPS O-acetylase OafA/YrhL
MNTPASEPVRRNVYAAAIVVAAATFFATLGLADPLTWQTVFAALGVGLGQVALLAFGVERARDQAWSPKSVGEIMDAEAVIAQAEAEGRA